MFSLLITLIFSMLISMLFFILLLLSAIIYPFHMVEKGCDNLPKELPKEKTLDLAFNRAVLRVYYNDIRFLMRYGWSSPKSEYYGYNLSVCADYQELKKYVREKSKIDYADNHVNTLLFDYSQLNNYYRIKDIGEAAFNRARSMLSEKIFKQTEVKIPHEAEP